MIQKSVPVLVATLLVVGCAATAQPPSPSAAATRVRPEPGTSSALHRVPNVVGMRGTDGAGTVVYAGFKMYAPGLNDDVPFVITAQRPAGGVLAPHSTTVRLTVRVIPQAVSCRTDQVTVRLAQPSDTIGSGHHTLGFAIGVRNRGRVACSVAGPPQLRFFGQAVSRLDVRVAAERGGDRYTVLAAAGTAPSWVSTAWAQFIVPAADDCARRVEQPTRIEVETGQVRVVLALPWKRAAVCSRGGLVESFGSDD